MRSVVVLVVGFAFASASSPTGCRNFAVVNILQAGGRSITKHFEPEYTQESSFLSQLRYRCRDCGTTHEVTAHSQRDENRTSWDNAYKISIVRNPFDWLMSVFFYEKVMCLHHPNHIEDIEKATKTTSFLCNLSATQHARPHRETFRDWVHRMDDENHLHSTWFLLPNPAVYPTVQEAGNSSAAKKASQHSWISNKTSGQLIVDEVVRFENASQVQRVSNPGRLLRWLCNYVPMSYDNAASSVLEVTHPEANATDLYDQATCAIVTEHFDVDFDMFGYNRDCPAASKR